MNKKYYWILMTAVMMGLTMLDQVTKVIATATLKGKGVINVMGDYIILNWVQNRGAFLSMGNQLGDGWWMFGLVILPIIILSVVTVYVFLKKREDLFMLTFWALVVSGGAGNLIDRIFIGKVTDFMNIGIGNVLRSGVFNVADLYIVAAFFLVVFESFFKKPKPKVAEAVSAGKGKK